MLNFSIGGLGSLQHSTTRISCSRLPGPLAWIDGPTGQAWSPTPRPSGAAGGVAGARQHDELDPFSGLVRLRPGQRQHQAVGVLGDLVDR